MGRCSPVRGNSSIHPSCCASLTKPWSDQSSPWRRFWAKIAPLPLGYTAANGSHHPSSHRGTVPTAPFATFSSKPRKSTLIAGMSTASAKTCVWLDSSRQAANPAKGPRSSIGSKTRRIVGGSAKSWVGRQETRISAGSSACNFSICTCQRGLPCHAAKALSLPKRVERPPASNAAVKLKLQPSRRNTPLVRIFARKPPFPFKASWAPSAKARFIQ